MIKIFDNIFSPEDEDLIEQEVLSQKYNSINNLGALINSIPNGDTLPILPQDVSMGGDIKGPLQKYLRQILKLTKTKSKINFGAAKRWKINKLSPINDPSVDKWGIHVDNFKPHYSLIYYVNDSDGDTIFYNDTLGDKFEDWMSILGNNKDLSYWKENKRVSPKKGRLVIFDGRIFHKSTYPTTQDRYVINFNVEISPKNTTLI